jgi:TolB-like protein
MSLFTELKRRNVIRVGLAYLLGAWVLLQGADFALDVAGAPEWIIRALTGLAAIGLPAVLIFAWVFEMTPEGLRRETEIDPETSITPQTGHKLDRVITGFLVLAVLVLLGDRFLSPAVSPDQPIADRAPTSPAAEPAAITPETETEPAPDTSVGVNRQSVAVLPFAFRSTNPEDEFFAEGMHDDLLTQLAKIGSLKVISRTSVMEYKDTTKKIPEIASELGVATIVEGGVQRSGSRVRINAQLIDAGSDEHLWAETFNRELTAENLFDIQAEIAESIAGALQATLSPQERAEITRRLTDNLEAWESYRRALRMRLSQVIPAIDAGLNEIEHAISLDPQFAAAYSLRAILLLQRFWFFDPDPALRDQAWDAITRGRAIDPDLPELDLAEGFYHYWGFLNYGPALAALDRASARLPNDARIHQARSYVLRRLGRWDESLSALQKAVEISPREGINLADMGDTLLSLQRYDEAKAAIDAAMEVKPDSLPVLGAMGDYAIQRHGDVKLALRYLALASQSVDIDRYWVATLYNRDLDLALKVVDEWPEAMLKRRVINVTRPLLQGLTLWFAGRLEEALPLIRGELPMFERLLRQSPGNYPILQSLCQIKGALGDFEAALEACRQADAEMPRDEYLKRYNRFSIATGLAMAGATDEVLAYIENALDADVVMSTHHYELHPAFYGLRDHPVFIELMNRYRPENQK